MHWYQFLIRVMFPDGVFEDIYNQHRTAMEGAGWQASWKNKALPKGTYIGMRWDDDIDLVRMEVNRVAAVIVPNATVSVIRING